MNYFIGSLYGDYEGYMYIKERLKLKANDNLWILGDVLDGNDANPEQIIQIIEDIQISSNIHLILGDHEFAHIMRFVSMNNKEGYDSWKNYLINMNVSGEALVWYFEHVMDEYEQEAFFSYLIQECEISKLLPIGDNYFYLVHGFPMVYTDNLTKWQLETTTGTITQKPFFKAILTDPSFVKEELSNIHAQNCFVICSHQNIQSLQQASTIYHKSGVFLLGEDKPNEQIPILGIDAAGYFINNILYNN